MERLIQIPLAANEPTNASSGRQCDTCKIADAPLFRYDVIDDDDSGEEVAQGAFAFCSDQCFSMFLPMNRRFLVLYSQYRRDALLEAERTFIQ